MSVVLLVVLAFGILLPFLSFCLLVELLSVLPTGIDAVPCWAADVVFWSVCFWVVVQGWVQTTSGRIADRIGCCIVSVVSVFKLAPAQAG